MTGGSDGESAVVAGPVALVAVQDVEEGGVSWADQAVGVDVRVWGAPFSGDRVDPFDVLRAEVVENLRDQPDGLVLADARAKELVELGVGRVDHRRGLGEE